MPLQNRVDPWGKLHAVSDKGLFLGNRGIIHNDQKEIIASHKIQGWVTCRLSYKGVSRQIMAPGKYTELFFLDEATAFSAGHRPCAQCRNKRYREFKKLWIEANVKLLGERPPTAANIDKIIHHERINKGEKVTYTADCMLLPNGTIVQINSSAYIIWEKELFKWSFSGYSPSEKEQEIKSVEVLTPKSYVRMYSKGYIPCVHESLEKY